MGRETGFFKSACLFIAVWLLPPASALSAKSPYAAPGMTQGVVAVSVRDRTGKHVASATGMVIDARGVVATSCYVIPKWLEAVENTLWTKGEDGIDFPLEYLISRNCNNGIALIKIKGNAFPSMKIASGYKPRKGEAVTVLSAKGPEITATETRIKSTGKDEGFQVTVPITPGRDGSPVVNMRGEVIGVAAFLSIMQQRRPTVLPSKNVVKEFTKHKHLIQETPPPPRVPSPPAAAAPLPGQQRGGKENDAERYLALGYAYEKTNMRREAIEAYKEAIRSKPDYFDAHVTLGLAYYKTGRYDEAADAYLRAIAIRPNDKSVYNKLGATYIILGSYSMALDTFRQSLKLDPRNPETHFNLGIALVITGDRSGAIAEYGVLKTLDRERAAQLMDLIY